jgi:hypothetical protein
MSLCEPKRSSFNKDLKAEISASCFDCLVIIYRSYQINRPIAAKLTQLAGHGSKIGLNALKCLDFRRKSFVICP